MTPRRQSKGPSRVVPPRVLLLLGLWLCLPLSPVHAEDEEALPLDVPIAVTARLDAEDMAATGRLRLHLEFVPAEDITRIYSVQLRLYAQRSEVLELDHAPQPGTRTWRKGQVVAYDLPVPLPLDVEPGAKMGFFLSFWDAEREVGLPPRQEGRRFSEHRRLLGFPMPDLGSFEDPALIEQALARAAKLADDGLKADAWSVLELGLRRAVQDKDKYRFRDALVDLGVFAPRPISLVEREIIRSRIEEERRRYLRLISGRLFDRKQYHGALRILESIGGKLSEDARGAVIGALDQAKRAERDILDLKVRILGRVSDKEKQQAAKAIGSLGFSKALLERAESWARKKQYAAARIALRDLALNAADRAVADAAVKMQEKVEQRWLAATPAEEAKVVQEAISHPAFDRTKAIATHKFIYIGPEVLINGIAERGRRRFDLAYVFLTDLFGRIPNPAGDRVTVYFKELWDFGGGVGGGKRIDIGKADPARRGLRVDVGLLYHELTHCIDDTNPTFAGWREGLANFGAAYAYEALAQDADSLHSFESNLRAFHEDYLSRDMAYWRIQNYGPSAGFFLHFVEKHSKVGRGHDWKPYRQFFREYRAAPLPDGREPYVARAAAYYLVRAFGPAVFDDLLAFRFPLRPDDREALTLEMEAFARRGYALPLAGKRLTSFPGSPLPRDLLAGRMRNALRARDAREATRLSKEKLGILHAWKVIGPFKQKGASPGACVFPPEFEIDYAKEYPGETNMCRWRDVAERGAVTIDPTGYVGFNFNYQNDTATYALCYVTVPEDMDAFLHARADDDLTIFLNDRLVENYLTRGRNASAWLAWRGPGAPVPDAVKLPVKLTQGRNKLLVKVRNRRGKAGFILALSKLDGRPIPGLSVDTKAPPGQGSSRVADPRGAEKKSFWKSTLKMTFKTKAFSSKLETSVGKFKVVGGALKGQDKGKRVGWRKYTVRPGFPKDSPSNLFWLKARYTKDLEDFRLRMDFAPQGGKAPKVVVTIMGDGKQDALSGWNLILHARGKEKVGAQLERYEHLYYQTPPLVLPANEIQSLELVYVDGRLTVKLGEAVLFRDVSLTGIAGGSRIGLSTFGPDPGLEHLQLWKRREP